MPRRLITASLFAAAIFLSIPFFSVFGYHRSDTEPVLQARQQTTVDVVARGRIEPEGGVIVVSGPPESLSTVAIVDKLLVSQGDLVTPGRILAVLSGFDLAKADLDVSRANLRVAQLTYAQLLAGIGKAAEIAAQSNVLAARRVQMLKAERDWQRATTLVERNVGSVQLLENQKAALDQVTQEVEQAQNALTALTEVRLVDEQLALGQIAVAEANVQRAQAVVERLQIRARAPGTVLSIQTRSGEVVSSDGILRIGDLDRLIVVAEVDQSQIGLVKAGMPASLEGGVLTGPIKATVLRSGNEVNRQRRPSSDILLGRDARIVEVDMMPEKPLPRYVGAEVTVRLRSSSTEP